MNFLKNPFSRRLLSRLVEALILLTLAGHGCPASAATTPVTGQYLPGMEPIDQYFQSLTLQHGMSVAIAYQGRLVLARGYGTADDDGTPVQPSSLFRIASISKSISCGAILTLVQQGQLSLDAPVFSVLTGYQAVPVPKSSTDPFTQYLISAYFTTPLDPRMQQITIRQILNLTTGLQTTASTGIGELTLPFFPAAQQEGLGLALPLTHDEIIGCMLNTQLFADPGTTYDESEFASLLMGRLIEKIAGIPYENFMRNDYLANAGITQMRLGHTLQSEAVPGEVTYYFEEFPGYFPSSAFTPGQYAPYTYGAWNIDVCDSDAGWLGSPIDLVRYMTALNGSRPPALLDASTIATMTAPPPDPALDNNPALCEHGGSDAYYGLGMAIEQVTGESGPIWWHQGGLPGSYSAMCSYPEGWTISVMWNSWSDNEMDSTTVESAAFQPMLDALTPPTGDLFPSYIAPVFTTQPSAQTVVVGGSATLSAALTGSTPITYQWSHDGTAVPNATGPSLNLTNLGAADIGSYTVVASNAGGIVTSNPAALAFAGTFEGVSVATAAPGTVTAGTPVTMSINGAAGYTYQWLLNGNPIPAATSATYTPGLISGSTGVVGTTDAGNYAVQVTDSTGNVGYLGLGTLGVTSNAWLINLSARAYVGNGADVLIAGFITTGPGNKNILVRGAGPALSPPPFNVQGALAAPQLDLYSGQTDLQTVTKWDSTLASTFSGVGAFSWATGSSDSAFLYSFAPGAYTTIVSGVGTTTGVALAELYDADATSAVASSSGGLPYNTVQGAPANRLINISARADIQSGANVLIGGFVFTGTTPKTFLVRASGPALAQPPASLTGTLSSTLLTLYDSAGKPVATNQGWSNPIIVGTSPLVTGTTAQVGLEQGSTALFQRAGASTWSSGSGDSAMLITLPPGAYTAIESGANGATGIGLVEIFEVD